MSIINYSARLLACWKAGRPLSGFHLKGRLEEHNTNTPHNSPCKGKFRGGGFLWPSVWIGLRRCGILTAQHEMTAEKAGQEAWWGSWMASRLPLSQTFTARFHSFVWSKFPEHRTHPYSHVSRKTLSKANYKRLSGLAFLLPVCGCYLNWKSSSAGFSRGAP